MFHQRRFYFLSSIHSTLPSAPPVALGLLLLRPVTSIWLNPTETLECSSYLISLQHLMRLIIYSFKYFLFTGSCDVTLTAFSFYLLLFPANSIRLLNLHLLSFSLAEPLPSCVVGSCLYVTPFILSPLGLKVKKKNNIGLGIILTSVTVSVLPLNVNYVFSSTCHNSSI